MRTHAHITGISKGLDNTLAKAKTQIGTPYYLSPEICQGKNYSFATDVRAVDIN
jgi:NIMA (never in mitosis gene a)-related kinase